jgi:hypothetical protein
VQRFDSIPDRRLTRFREGNMDTVITTGSANCIRLCCLLVAVGPVYSQFFGSGSKGLDGPLILTTPGTVLFEPRSFDPPINQSGDNVFHFTSIYVGKGVTVKLSAKLLQGPVFWLAQGPVQIEGTIDLDGENGGQMPSLAGAGGYPGGGPGQDGYGPRDTFKRNSFLVPLVGGFGGAGGGTEGGGGGGGALMIASSASITVNGAITANGGASSDGLGGGGGAIRLVAPAIDGSGVFNAKGGSPSGSDGLVRFETFDSRFTGTFGGTPFATGKPFGLFLPPSPPASAQIISINGVPFTTAQQFTFRQPERVSVVIEAHFVPPSTSVQLECFAEGGLAQTVATPPLVGTFELSRTAVSVSLPGGSSACQIKAEWKQPIPSRQRR